MATGDPSLRSRGGRPASSLVSRTQQFGLLFGRKFREMRTDAVQCSCRDADSEKLGGSLLTVKLVKFS